MRGGKYYRDFVRNLVYLPAVNEFLESVKIWQSYCLSLAASFLLDYNTMTLPQIHQSLHTVELV